MTGPELVRPLLAAALAAALAVPAAASGNDRPLRRPAEGGPEAAVGGFLAAEVAADGSLVAGAGAVSSGRMDVGTYFVTFNRHSLHRRCFFTASVADRDGFETPVGFATIDALGGSNNGLYVRVFDAGGASLDAQFIVVAVCR